VRKRHNLHMHVFVIERRWRKAWLYTLLAVIHTTSAARRALLPSGPPAIFRAGSIVSMPVFKWSSKALAIAAMAFRQARPL